MIIPESLDIASLPWLPLDARTAFPRNPSIYFAIDKNNVIQYIGLSVDPKSRWASHHKYDVLAEIGNIKIAYLFIDEPYLLRSIESALIKWFQPPLNIAGKNIRPYEEDDFLEFNSVSRSGSGDKMRKLREKQGLTQRALSERVGVTDQSISNWELGLREPRLTPIQMFKLCQALGCTLEELAFADKK